MIKIQSLLNAPPSPNVLPPYSSLARGTHSPPPTPDYTSQASSVVSSPAPRTPVNTTSTNFRQKLPKDAALFQRGPAKEPVNYPPYECAENNGVLSASERKELIAQHKRFKIFPAGGQDGLIYDYVRHIPYNSEKKTFFGRTGREGFELFQYVFNMPNEPGKDYVVMWDYQNGLVRITPFFKALNFAKTTPNKVLGANVGLRELSHSITGGSIAAQGYWMPYGCARAVCATFCWNIRWALTPIFGPSFLKDCIPPSHPNYSRFRIDAEVIRVSQRECEGWNNGRDTPPMSQTGAATPSNVTSAPRAALPTTTSSGVTVLTSPKNLRPRKPRIQTDLDPPFSSDSDEENHTATTTSQRNRYGDSPSVSPKTKISPFSTWTSINTRGYNTHRDSPPTSEDGFTPKSFGTGYNARGPSDYTPKTDMRNYYFMPQETPTPLTRNTRMPPPPTRHNQDNAQLFSVPATNASGKKRARAAVDEDDDSGSDDNYTTTSTSTSSSNETTTPPTAKRSKIDDPGVGKIKPRDFDAAIALLALNKEDAMLAPNNRSAHSSPSSTVAQNGGMMMMMQQQSPVEYNTPALFNRDERSRQASLRMKMMLDLEQAKVAAGAGARKARRGATTAPNVARKTSLRKTSAGGGRK